MPASYDADPIVTNADGSSTFVIRRPFDPNEEHDPKLKRNFAIPRVKFSNNN